jgi:conjugative transfer region protein (TIGR03750 family)
MLLNSINFKMPIYKDCTFGELMMTGTLVFIVELICLGSLLKLTTGFASIGVAITFMTFWLITKGLIIKLQKIKYGKPYGYYKHALLLKLSELRLMKSFYITRIGKWSVRRTR